jgi:hypothetical protein
MRRDLLPQELHGAYRRVLDRRQHEFCTSVFAAWMADKPDLYAGLVNEYAADGEAVRAELYRLLPRVAAIAVMVDLANAASRIYASKVVFSTQFALADVARLLKGEVGFTGPLLKLSGGPDSAEPVAAAVILAKLRRTGHLAGLVPNEAGLRALIALIVNRMLCMEGGELPLTRPIPSHPIPLCATVHAGEVIGKRAAAAAAFVHALPAEDAAAGLSDASTWRAGCVESGETFPDLSPDQKMFTMVHDRKRGGET